MVWLGIGIGVIVGGAAVYFGLLWYLSKAFR